MICKQFRIGTVVPASAALTLLAATSPAGAASALITLATFDGANQAGPYAGVIGDAAGNLYGTTRGGGSNGGGSVYGDVRSTAAVVTLVPLDGATSGSQPLGLLYRDPNGDLYGTAEGGGGAAPVRCFASPAGPAGLP